MKAIYKNLALAIPLVLAASLTAKAAMAPKIDAGKSPAVIDVLFGKKKQEAPAAYPIHDDATFAANTKTFDIMLFEQADLEFTITLPKNWKLDGQTDAANPFDAPAIEDAANLSQRLGTDTAKFKSPMIGTSQAIVTVQAIPLEHEISALNWLKNYVIISGYSPDGKVSGQTDSRASAGAFYTVENLSFYTYMTAQISGNRIVLARFDIPLNLKETLSYLIKKSVDSFTMPFPKTGPIEQQNTFSMADAIKFNYPVSWDTSGSSLKDLNRLTLRLNNRDNAKKLQGTIQVTAVRRTRSTRLMSEMDTLKKFFTDLKFQVGDMTVSDKLPASNRFIFNRYEVYKIQKEGQNQQELHIAILGDASWYVIAFLVTPQEADSLYTWARNTQTFEQLVQSIK